MATSKLEIPICQREHKIAPKFQMLYLSVRVPAIQKTSSNAIGSNGKKPEVDILR